MKIRCEVDQIMMQGGDYGDLEIPGVSVTCTRCSHETESYGTDERSVRRCFALMREECPRGERNFYFHTGGE